MSALVHFADSSRTSREAREVAGTDSCTAAKLHHHHSITSSAPTSCTARDQGRDQRVSRIRRL